MINTTRTAAIGEDPRPEMIFAIKERIAVLTNGNGAPVRLNKILVGGDGSPRRGVAHFYELTNVFVDDGGRLCGDLVCRNGRMLDEVLFGRSIEDLELDDLTLILDALYSDDWVTGGESAAPADAPERNGLPGFFLGGYAGLARLLRKNA